MEVPQTCRQDCLHKDNPDDGDQIRCILCCVWHHIDCVSVPKKEMKALWSCYNCRLIAKSVKDMNETLLDMQKTQNSMLQLIQEMTDKMKSEFDLRKKAETELEKVAKDLSDANQKLQHLSRSNSEPLSIAPPPLQPTAPPKPSLLLGTSLLRNIDARKLENVEVIAKGGATVHDLNVALSAIPDNKMYHKIIITGGSIDVEGKSSKDITEDFQALAVSAALRAEQIVLCSIPPRLDKELTDTITNTNKDIQDMTNKEGITFVDLDEHFLLKNGSVNKLLLHHDGLHLSNHGVDSLIRACEVKMKKDSDSAFNNVSYEQNRPVFFKGHTHPLSNFYPLKDFVMDGVQFATSEAAYVYCKALFHNDHRTATAVKTSQTGIHAKRLGDKIITGESWHAAKVDIMDDIIRRKLETCPDARNALLATNEKDLIEDTHNRFWGRGTDNDGLNMLGKMWSMYRRKLRNNSLPRRRQWATRQNQPKCYRCGEPGHLLENCRKTENVNCWNCKQPGHKQKHCRRFASNDRRHFY